MTYLLTGKSHVGDSPPIHIEADRAEPVEGGTWLYQGGHRVMWVPDGLTLQHTYEEILDGMGL